MRAKAKRLRPAGMLPWPMVMCFPDGAVRKATFGEAKRYMRQMHEAHANGQRMAKMVDK